MQEEELAQWRQTQTERVHLELRQMRQQGMAAERQLREEAERGISRMVQSAEHKLKQAVDVNMMHAQEMASSKINQSLGNVMGEWNKKMFKEAALMPVNAAVNWEVRLGVLLYSYSWHRRTMPLHHVHFAARYLPELLPELELEEYWGCWHCIQVGERTTAH